MYTHLIKYEKYNKFFKAWMPGFFRTVASNVPPYTKMMSVYPYRNFTIEIIQ